MGMMRGAVARAAVLSRGLLDATGRGEAAFERGAFFVDRTIIAIFAGTAPSDNRFPMVQRSEWRALATPMSAPIGRENQTRTFPLASMPIKHDFDSWRDVRRDVAAFILRRHASARGGPHVQRG